MKDSLRRLVFLRHGVTAPQEQGRYCGHLDPPLSERGREQVARSQQSVLGLHPSQVWCSDLQRCTETATLIFPFIPYRALAELREIAFGDFENRQYSEIASEVNRILLDPECCFPAGESLHQLSCRVAGGMKKILDEPGETAAVIGHAGSIAAASLWLLDRPLRSFWSFQLPHAGRAIFERSAGRWADVTADWIRRQEDDWPT